jgi:type IV pilus assembly protein PilN
VKVPINLASEPFRRDRPMLVGSVVGCIAAALLLVFLITTIAGERDRAKSTRLAIARLNGQLRVLSAEQAKLDATLRQPRNAEVLERSVMLNALIERKAISWTRTFSDLEKVLPHNVRLINIRLPQVNSSNQVVLDMVVGAQNPEALQDFLKKLENSPLFGPAQMSSYLPPTQNEPLHRYRVSVNYAQKL